MTTALQEIVDAFEEDRQRYHGDVHAPPWDKCRRCEPDRSLISRARAEMERGVDVYALAIAAGVLLNDTGTLHAIREELQRQGIPTTTRQPHVS